MENHAITIRSETDRAKVMNWLRGPSLGWRVEVRAPKRTDAQNSRMWAILARIAKVGMINGKHFKPEQWKVIFMAAMGHKAVFLPTLDGASFTPTGFRSSQLSVEEMSDLQTFMESWAAELGIDTHEGYPGSDEFTAGAQAFSAGAAAKTCPWGDDRPKATDWLAGWHGAKQAGE